MPILFTVTVLIIIAIFVIILFPLMPKIGKLFTEWFKWNEEDKNKTDEEEK